MQIELAMPGRMTQSGSSLLRLIQNNNMPILDLFVRESVQNSLDAGLPDVHCVDVHFIKGEFDSIAFSGELSGITDALRDRYPCSKYSFLAVRDSNTFGLTGPMNYSAVEGNQYGNLMKLVYEISKPQDQEGAGGSWGLGKTVYFRIGIGLVLYYSRIKTEDGYQSRLAATLVEDESADDALLPRENDRPNRGIAWWGRKTGDNETEPLVDDDEVLRIIQQFGIEPYMGEQTGTTVVIPYIDEEHLLNNNATVYTEEDGHTYIPVWRYTIDDYLWIALQRWYSPRLNNLVYPYGKYLRAYVNNARISMKEMEPFFAIVQTLYNKANSANVDFPFSVENDQAGTEPILLRNTFVDSTAGSLAYIKISKNNLQMTVPPFCPAPCVYTNDEMRWQGYNAPIVCFVRKPGMIVAYESAGKWADGIPQTGPDDYIIAVFVLNSQQRFKEEIKGYPNLTLEEYVRKSEMADHTSWRDMSLGTYNPRIITKVQNQISKKLTQKFGIEQTPIERQQSSGMGKLFGDMLLPPKNFKKQSVSGDDGENNSSERIAGRRKSIVLSVADDSVSYRTNAMHISLHLYGGRKFESADICLGMESDGGIITSEYWKNKMGLMMPFVISSASIVYDKPKVGESYEEEEQLLESWNSSAIGNIFSSENIILGEDCIGIKITGDGRHALNACIDFVISLKSQRQQAVIYLGETKEG